MLTLLMTVCTSQPWNGMQLGLSIVDVCRACLEYLWVSGRQPEIIHAHEWQLSAVPMLYWWAAVTDCTHAYPRTTQTLTIFSK